MSNWVCCKLERLKGGQFCTKPDCGSGHPDLNLYRQIMDVLSSGYRRCKNLATGEVRDFSPRCFACRFFVF